MLSGLSRIFQSSVRNTVIGGRRAGRLAKRVGTKAKSGAAWGKDLWVGGLRGTPNRAGAVFGPQNKYQTMWSDATAPFARNPVTTKLGIAGVAGAYGYTSGEGTTGQRVERALGFATMGGLGASSRFRGVVKHQLKVGKKAVGMYGVKGGISSMTKRTLGGLGGTARMAGVGALYGAVDEDSTILGGAVTGAGIGILGKGLIKAQGRYIEKNPSIRDWMRLPTRPESRVMTIRHGAAAGGAIGGMMGGPVGMVAGAGVGGAAGGFARFARKHPGTAKAMGGTALIGGMSAMIVGGAAANAYSMHQRPRQTDFGADGDLALGLHALRHG